MAVEVLTEEGPAILECGMLGYLAYQTRDIGYGVEEDAGEFMFCGPAHGKLMFVLSNRPIYLFADEIEDWIPDAPYDRD